MKRFTYLLLCASSLAPATAWAADTAPPANSEGTIGEIVVTAQKRAENIQDVPISISALDSKALETKGINSVADMTLKPITGLSAQSFAGNPQILILDLRGVTTPDPGQATVEPGVAIYVDDVYVSRAQGAGNELADPERIEVLKGPQGTLFGRNAEGGAIRIVSKKPTGELGLDAKVTIGDYGFRKYLAHVNLPEVAGISLKFDFLHTDLDGYVRNGSARVAALAHQNTFGAQDVTGFRVAARWKPVDALTIDYSYDHLNSKVASDYLRLTNPGALAASNPLYVPPATLSAPVPQEADVHTFYPASTIPMYQDANKDNTRAHTLTAALEVSPSLTLKSITGYRKLNSSGSNNLGNAQVYTRLATPTTVGALGLKAAIPGQTLAIDPTTPVFALGGSNPLIDYVTSKAWSEELQLLGKTDTLEYVLGGYYYSEEVADSRATPSTLIFTSATAAPIAINPFFTGTTVGTGRTIVSAKTKTYAAFAQATWSPAFADGKLHLTAGLRYTDDKKTFQRSMFNGSTSTVQTGTAPAFGGGTVPVIPVTTGKPFSDKRWDPAATIAYDITPDANVYFRYAQAYKSGGVGVRSSGFVPFGAEVNKSFELGFKSELFDRHVRLNGALFHNRISNRQFTFQPAPATSPSITDIANAPGITKVTGVELDAVIAPTENLTVSLSGSRTWTKLPAETLALNNGLAPSQQSVFYVQNTPKWQGSAAVDYAFPRFNSGSQLKVHVDYSIASDVIGQARVSTTAFLWPLERHQGNLRVGLEDIPIGSTKLRIAGFVNNFTNEIYPIFSASSAWYITNPPRTMGLELGISF